ncbi:MAG: hypothetical protein QXN15_07680 [Candidatus Jordarchaeales archaeon]|nr:hypothetical protein [Candidatus Jordarchaeia archaeon]
MSDSLLLTETCKFKLEPSEEQAKILEQLFSVYADMFEECLNKAIEANITSRRRLHEVIYRRLRRKYPEYPSHYVYTAITQALAMLNLIGDCQEGGRKLNHSL